MEDSIKFIEIIPLFEQVNKIIDSPVILKKYINMHKKMFGRKPQYLRPYCARSDPALNSGLIPTILALKVALSSYLDLEKETGVRLYPMLGTGSLPFRGGLSPERLDLILEEYKGVRTLTLQSAFRYDYKLADIKKAIQKLHEKLPKTSAQKLKKDVIENIKKCIPKFETAYRDSIENLANFAKTKNVWRDIMEDIDIIEKEFQITLGPVESFQLEHFQITQKIYERLKDNKD